MCEAYKKIAASRSKKKSPSKKEKEVFIKKLIPRIIEILANTVLNFSSGSRLLGKQSRTEKPF